MHLETSCFLAIFIFAFPLPFFSLFLLIFCLRSMIAKSPQTANVPLQPQAVRLPILLVWGFAVHETTTWQVRRNNPAAQNTSWSIRWPSSSSEGHPVWPRRSSENHQAMRTLPNLVFFLLCCLPFPSLLLSFFCILQTSWRSVHLLIMWDSPDQKCQLCSPPWLDSRV